MATLLQALIHHGLCKARLYHSKLFFVNFYTDKGVDAIHVSRDGPDLTIVIIYKKVHVCQIHFYFIAFIFDSFPTQ